jgi:hypothetical protein
MQDEMRTDSRQRTFKGGSISTPEGVWECVIRNLSITGAQIEVTGQITLPNTFRLIIKPEIVTRTCKIAWRSAQRIGVRFVSP